MSEPYTPTTSEVRAEYWSTRDHPGERAPDRAREFDRWLTEHDRQVAERAWDEGAWMGHHLYDKPIQEVKAHSPYRAAKGEQKWPAG